MQVRKLPQVQPDKIAALGCDILLLCLQMFVLACELHIMCQ